MGKLILGMFVGLLIIMLLAMSVATFAVGNGSPIAWGDQYRTVQYDIDAYQVDDSGHMVRPPVILHFHKGDQVTIILAGENCIIRDNQGRRAILNHATIGF
jgi:hypothetical protein